MKKEGGQASNHSSLCEITKFMEIFSRYAKFMKKLLSTKKKFIEETIAMIEKGSTTMPFLNYLLTN